MEINRDSYICQLIDPKHNGLVKVITVVYVAVVPFLLDSALLEGA